MLGTICLVTREEEAPVGLEEDGYSQVTTSGTITFCQRTHGHGRAQRDEEFNTIYLMLK